MVKINFSDSFLASVCPSNDELWAHNALLTELDRSLGDAAAALPTCLKNNPQWCQITFENSDLQMDWENWWKHMLGQKAIHEICSEFNGAGQDVVAKVYDCLVEPGYFEFDFICDGHYQQNAYTEDTLVEDLSLYPSITSQPNFKKFFGLCSQIGGLNASLVLNSPDTAPKSPSVIVTTKAGIPFGTVRSRYEQSGPVN